MTKKKKSLIIILSVLALVVAAAVCIVVYINMSARADEISLEEAQSYIDDALLKMHENNSRKSMNYIAENTTVTAVSMEYGLENDIAVHCRVSTLNLSKVIDENYEKLLSISTVDKNGRQMTSTKIKLLIDPELLTCLQSAERIETEATVMIYQTKNNGYVVYTSDEMVDACFGGLASSNKKVVALEYITVNGEQVKAETNLKKGLTECLKLDYETGKPDTSVALVRSWNSFVAKFKLNFIEGARWKYLTNGLAVTLKITFFAVILGIVLGFLVAIVRCTRDKTGKLKILNAICKFYLTVIRGTPVLVQLMIIYFVIFMPLNVDKVIAAILCFGLNSGAYVAEIVRGGIMAVDNGQFEAGRSLGFNYVQTMWYIILPQAFKAVLPALANEFIVLLKETSVSSYIGISDLARGGDIIRGATFTAFLPLIAVALIYLVMVVGLSKLVSLLERRLRKCDRG